MKKHISILLALRLLLSCFTGCGKAPTAQDTDGEYLPLFSCGLLPVQDDETRLCGYVNNKAEMIIPLQFEDAKRFSSCGLPAVRLDGKWGFINTRGKTVIEPRFEEVEPFSEQGFAEVAENGKWGIVNKDGEMVVEPLYDEILTYVQNGLTAVKKADRWGYIDASGNMEIAAEFERIDAFSAAGFARVCRNGKWGVIDTAGTTVVELRYEFLIYDPDGLSRVKQDGKFGYIDPSGEMVIQPRFEKARAFHKNTAVVCLNEEAGYGIIDARGNFLVETGWEEISYDSGPGLYKLKKGEETAWFNPDGSMTEEFRLNITGIFGKNGLAPFEQDGKYGYADRFGRIVIQPVYDTAKEFGNLGLAAVQLGEKWCYIDKNGKVKLEIYAQQAGSFTENGLARVQINEKWGFINQKGKTVIEPRFDLAIPFRGKYAHIVQEGKFGLIDQKGNIVVAPQYDCVAPYPVNGHIAVWSDANRTYGYTDEKGRLVIGQRFSYDAVYSYIEISELFGPFYDDGYSVVREELQASGYEIRVIDKTGKCILGSENGLRVLDWQDVRGALIRRERDRNPIWPDGA